MGVEINEINEFNENNGSDQYDIYLKFEINIGKTMGKQWGNNVDMVWSKKDKKT